MMNPFRAFVRVVLEDGADVEVLVFRLKGMPEVELVHHFKKEGTLLLFVITRDQLAYERLLKALGLMAGVARYESWPLSPFRRSLTVPGYEPGSWLLSAL
jgi:hypothetical protein